jgi:sugar phosphate permease
VTSPHRPGTRSYRWVILAVATCAQATACFFVQGLGALGGYLQDDLDLSTFQVGLLLSAAQLVPLLGLIVAGELLDRLGERIVVTGGTLLVGAALIAGSFATSYGWLLLALLVVGAGYSTAQPGGSKSVATWFTAEQRGLAMGIRQAGLPLGGAAAAASLPWVSQRWGWPAALLVGGITATTGALLFVTLYRQPGRVVQPSAGGETGPATTRRRDLLHVPAMRRIVVSGTALISVQYGLLLLTTLYLHEKTGMSLGRAATFVLISQTAGVAGRITLAAFSDRSRHGRFALVRWSLAACAVGLVALMLCPLDTAWVLAPIIAWLGFFGIGWYGPWVTHLAEVSPPDRTGFGIGLAMSANQIAVVLAPPLLGLLRDQTGGFTTSWTVLVAACLLALIATRPRPAEGRAA